MIESFKSKITVKKKVIKKELKYEKDSVHYF